jgi:hypothetical protein
LLHIALVIFIFRLIIFAINFKVIEYPATFKKYFLPCSPSQLRFDVKLAPIVIDNFSFFRSKVPLLIFNSFFQDLHTSKEHLSSTLKQILIVVRISSRYFSIFLSYSHISLSQLALKFVILAH